MSTDTRAPLAAALTEWWKRRDFLSNDVDGRALRAILARHGLAMVAVSDLTKIWNRARPNSDDTLKDLTRDMAHIRALVEPAMLAASEKEAQQ